jgi:hypothetical protein
MMMIVEPSESVIVLLQHNKVKVKLMNGQQQERSTLEKFIIIIRFHTLAYA